MEQPNIKSWKLHELHKTIIHTLKVNGQDFEVLKVCESTETQFVLTP